jgi:2-dehydropantoate 2-reductase
MKWACIGAGSIGLLFAGKLAASGADLTLLTRTEKQAHALQSEGLAIHENGKKLLVRVKTEVFGRDSESGTPAEEGHSIAASNCPDWILLAVKQQHLTDGFLRRLAKLAGAHAKLLCFQNGMGHVEKISAYIPVSRIYLAITTEGARKRSDREVDHTGAGVTRIGPARNESEGVFAEMEILLEKMLNQAGFQTMLSKHMDEAVWRKLLINAAINPLTALLGVKNGELLRNGHAAQLMRRIAYEGAEVARASGLALAGDGDLWEQIADVCVRTADNHSSMLQDLMDGRVTEIDWITGAILEQAGKLGVPVPANETVYRLVKALESQKRSER